MGNCIKCGSPINEGTKFCTNCGTKVEAPASVFEAVVDQPLVMEPLEKEPVLEEAVVAEPIVMETPEAFAPAQAVVEEQPIVQTQAFAQSEPAQAVQTPVVEPVQQPTQQQYQPQQYQQPVQQQYQTQQYQQPVQQQYQTQQYQQQVQQQYHAAAAGMKICPNCRSQIPNTTTFCTACGMNLLGPTYSKPEAKVGGLIAITILGFFFSLISFVIGLVFMNKAKNAPTQELADKAVKTGCITGTIFLVIGFITSILYISALFVS